MLRMAGVCKTVLYNTFLKELVCNTFVDGYRMSCYNTNSAVYQDA